MAETLKEKTAKGLFWGGLSNGVQQVLNLIFGICLARMLSQSDYGMIGMLTIFSNLAGALQGGGFISALNRKRNISQKDYNAVFWTTTIVGAIIYILLFFSAPLISWFYGIPELTPLARFIFIGFFITSLSIASRAYMFRNMMVRENAIILVSSVLLSGIVGIVMAFYGFAYWGLATQTILYASTVTLLSFFFSKWHPNLSFDFSPIKEMVGFSSKLIITSIFSIINYNIFSVILGKMYTPREVGNYSQANKWNYMAGTFIGNMVEGIAQPVFAKTEKDTVRQKRVFRKLLRFTAFVSFPAMFGLALIGKEFIIILLTEKWLESAIILQLLCIAGAFGPISGLFSSLIITHGHSSTYMWCTIALCLIQLAAVILAAPYGINSMIIIYVIISISWIFVWHHFARKEINLNMMEVIKDIFPYLTLSLLFIVIAYLITEGMTNLYISFIIKFLIVSLSYSISLWLFNSTIFKEFIQFIRKREL